MTHRYRQAWRILAATCLATALPAVTHAQAAPSATMTIHADHPGAVVNRQMFGQFAEHLGTGIYDGLWVGPNSRIPNVRGFRKDVVGALRALQVPVVRWPGGCFADEYHWREGIGPKARPSPATPCPPRSRRWRSSCST